MSLSFLTPDPIDLIALHQAVAAPQYGGTALFVGTVRAGPDDGLVTAIEYSAYGEMAEAECRRIIEEAERSWPDGRIALQHRIGSIPLGEASIAVIAAQPHRAEAFDACRYVIEQVKARVPVWKKEFFADGTMQWRENRLTNKSGARTAAGDND